MDISTLQSNLDFVKSLYVNKEWKDDKCRDEILEAIQECNAKIKTAFGESMHNLWDEKPSIEAVEKVVKKFPSTLSYEDEDGDIPIQAVAGQAVSKYVPLLATEGIKHKVGGEDARGGLLSYDSNRMNALESLCHFCSDDEERVNVFKMLRQLGLLRKNDIQEYRLLKATCFSHCRQRFEYLVSWDPDALIQTRIRNKPLIHYMVLDERDFSIHLLLKAGFEYHPKTGGVLFVKDDDGITGLDCMCNVKGVDEVMSLLHGILSPSCNYPILHHVFVKAPRHKDLFMKQFPWAYHLKDHNDRTLHQAVLAAGADVVNSTYMILASLTDDQIRTKDPVTTLYPFAAMAVGEHADLEKSFYLLRRQPSVMDR